MTLIGRIVGILMLLAVIFVPFILEYGIIKITAYTIGIIFFIGWVLVAVWLLCSNHKIPKW